MLNVATFLKMTVHSIAVFYGATQQEIVKCGFWHRLPILPLLWHANAIDEY